MSNGMLRGTVPWPALRDSFIFRALLLAGMLVIGAIAGEARQIPQPKITVQHRTVYIALSNIREAGGAYPIRQLAAVLAQHSSADVFHETWDIGSGPAQNECIVEYNRRKKTLTFYAFGCFGLDGPTIGCKYLFTGVSDRRLRKVAQLQTYSRSSAVSERRTTAIVDDHTYLPWFNELRRYGCERRKLHWRPLR